MTPDYLAYLRQLEKQHGLPAGLLAVQQRAESDFNPNAVSKAGAQGIAQFMPATAQEYGIDPFDPMQASEAQAKMMSSLLRKYDGDVPSALAGYNWGQGNVDRKGLAQAPEETRNYIDKISGQIGQQPMFAAGPGADPYADIPDAELEKIAGGDGISISNDGLQGADPYADMSDEELQRIAGEDKGNKPKTGLLDDLLQLPEKTALGLAKGLVSTGMTNYAVPAGKAIAGALANYGTESMQQFGKQQQQEIADFEKQLSGIMPTFTGAGSISDVGEAVGSAAGGLPFYLANPLSMIAGGATAGGQQAYEKTAGDLGATATGAAIGGGLNAVPAYMLGAGKGVLPAILGMGAFGAATPSLQRIPEQVAGMTPAPVSSDERINAALSGATLGGLGRAIGAASQGGKQVKAPTTEQVHEAAGKLYKAAEASGAAIKPTAVGAWAKNAEARIPAEKMDVMKTYGGDATLSKTLDAIRLEASRGNMSLERGMALYQQFGDMVQAHTALNGKMDATGKFLRDIQGDLHAMITNPRVQDISGGAAGFKMHQEAIKLWSTQSKMADIDRVLRNAETSDNPHLAIKNGFGSLYRNAKKTRGWSNEEKAALLKASKLGASGEVMRFVGGRLFPLITAGAGFATGGLAGIPAAAAAYGAANAARSKATKIQTKRANELKNVIASPVSGIVANALNPAKPSPMQSRLNRVATPTAAVAPAAKAAPVAAPQAAKPTATAQAASKPVVRVKAVGVPVIAQQPLPNIKPMKSAKAGGTAKKYNKGDIVDVGGEKGLKVIGKDGGKTILVGAADKDGKRKKYELSSSGTLKEVGTVKDMKARKGAVK